MPTSEHGHGRTQSLLLLTKLLDCRDHISPFTIVLDSLEQSAKPLIEEYIRRAKVTRTRTVVASLDSLRRPKGTDTFIRGYSLATNALASAIRSATEDASTQHILIIPNLHPLLSNPNISLQGFLLPLVRPNTTLLAVLHSDQPLALSATSHRSQYAPLVVTSLRYLATTIFRVRSFEHVLAEQRARQRSVAAPIYGVFEDEEGVVKGLHNSSTTQIVVDMEHRRKSGRAAHALFVLKHLSASQAQRENITHLEDNPAWQALVTSSDGDASVSGAAQTSFSLALTEKQRQDREGVVLPYFDAQREDQGGPGQGGRILYDMGVEDDFDEEEDEI